MSSLPPDLLPRVFASLRLVHSSSASASDRDAANRFLLELTKDLSISLALSDAILSSPIAAESATFPHFALHLLSESLASWPSLSESARLALKTSILQKFHSFHLIASLKISRSLAQKLSNLVGRLALLEYPMRWPTLISDLISFQFSLLSCLSLSEIGDSISGFQEYLTENRRREIQQALALEMHLIIPYLSSIIASSTNDSPDSKHSISAALNFLASAADWIEIPHLLARPITNSLSTLISSPEYFPSVCSILESISNRRATSVPPELAPAIDGVWSLAIRSMSSLVSNNSPDSIMFIQLIERVLSALVRNHLDRLVSVSATDLTPLNRLFSLLGNLLSHSNIQLNQNSLDLWLIIFRHPQLESSILSGETRIGLVAELARCISRKLMKPSLEQFESSGIENLEEANRFFGVIRNNYLALQHRLAQLEPFICFSVLLQRFDEFLSMPPSTDFLNELGYSSMKSRRFIEMESCCALIEFMFKDLPANSWVDSRLSSAAGELFGRIARFNPSDPCLQTRRLHSVAQFVPLFESTPALLDATLGVLLSGMAFISPAESGRQFDDLSEDTQACRRRAIHSLILIGKRVPNLIIPRFAQLSSAIHAIKLVEAELSLLVEFQVAVASSLSSVDEQCEHIRSFLQPALNRLSDTRIQQIMTDANAFRRILENADAESIEIRTHLAESLSTLTAVFKILPQNHPCVSIQTQLFSPLVTLLSLCHSSRSLFSGASCVKHLELMGVSLSPALMSARKWLDRITEFCQVILGCSGAALDHSAPPAIANLSSTLISLHPHELRFFIDKFLSPLFRSCAPIYLASVLTPAASSAFTAARSFLSAPPISSPIETLEIWVDSELRELARSSADLLAKLVQEVELAKPEKERKLKTEGESINNNNSSLNSFDSLSSPVKKEIGDVALLSHIPLFRYLFTDAAAIPLLHSLISLLAFLLIYPDSGAEFRSARFLARLCSAAVEFRCSAAIGEFSLVFRCALMNLSHCEYRSNMVSSLQSELIGLVKTIIERIGIELNSSIPYDILTQYPGIELNSISSLFQSLNIQQAEKKHKFTIKVWLEKYIIGRGRENENNNNTNGNNNNSMNNKFLIDEFSPNLFEQLKLLKSGRNQKQREIEMERRGENYERENGVEAIAGLFK